MTFVPPDPIPTAPFEGPCQAWTDVAAVRAQCGLTVAQAPDTAVQFGIDLASLVLWTATGRRYGLCRRTMRPCWEGDHANGFRPDDTSRTLADRVAELQTSGGVSGQMVCGCWLDSLVLPGPIAAVESVVVDGVALPAASFRIRTAGHKARRTLLRVDGETWPCCQALDEDPAVVPAAARSCPAWEVTYWQGRTVDSRAASVAGILAEQFAKSVCQQACDPGITPGLTRVSRRGVTKEFAPSDLRDPATGQTRTGMALVDAWISGVNPHGRVRPPAIVRADDPERRRLWSWVDAA